MHAEPTKPRPVSAFRSWHNHMRADHPKLWHPIRITIVVITVWWILFCLLLAPTDNPAAIVWTIIEIAVLLLSPFFPKSMSLLFLIIASRDLGSYPEPTSIRCRESSTRSACSPTKPTTLWRCCCSLIP